MLTTDTPLQGRDWLIVGNGPSAWHLLRRPVMRDVRRARPTLLTVACNMSAVRLRGLVTVAAAKDRSQIERLLRDRVHRSGVRLWVDQPGFADLMVGGASPPGGLVDGRNLFFFPATAEGTGTGDAVLQSVLKLRPRSVELIGFDGAAHPETRWSGRPGYRKRPTSAAQYDQWETWMAAQINAARRNDHRLRVTLYRLKADRPSALESACTEVWSCPDSVSLVDQLWARRTGDAVDSGRAG